jgi:hypothetical protein
MNHTELLNKIAYRLSGMNIDDMTTSERQISGLLIENDLMKKDAGGDVAATPVKDTDPYEYMTLYDKFRAGDEAIERGRRTWFQIVDSVGSCLKQRPEWGAARRKR